MKKTPVTTPTPPPPPPGINCFEWQNRSSDYLDGALIGAARDEADHHVETCKRCSERFGHYRTIVQSIGAQPRSPLPIPIRKAPLSFSTPRIDMKGHRSRWQAAPWYVRSGIEGLAIAFSILFVVAMVPRIRSLYERSMERRLEPFSLGDLPSLDESTRDAPKLARGKPATGEATESFTGEDEGEHLEDEDESSAGPSVPTGEKVRVGSSEIWRFNLRCDSPHDVRQRVVEMLTSQHIPANTPGIGGIEAPGGIQFDILVPTSVVANVKQQLQRIASATAAESDKTTPTEPFTWYRNKSKRPVPAGKARVVIWLSQI